MLLLLFLLINVLFLSLLIHLLFIYLFLLSQLDRKDAIEAWIVRIMKSQKVMDHTSLVNEVLSALSSFKVDPQQVKAKIEDLIHREYIERDKDMPSTYHYLA